MKKTGVVIIAAFLVSLLLPVFSLASLEPVAEKTGNHFGEEKYLEYKVEYLDTLGITIVDETGITYKPFSGPTTHDDTILPGQYFGEYPLYFGSSTLKFEVLLKNTGKRTYQNLLVIARQEFLNVDGDAGDPFPVLDAISDWLVDELRPNEEITLSGTMLIPNSGTSGIDQTHIQIIHWGNQGEANNGTSGGRIIIDDPQAGIWCPLR